MNSADQNRNRCSTVRKLIVLLCLGCMCELVVADDHARLTEAQVHALLQETQTVHEQAIAQGFGWRAVRLNLVASRAALQEGNLNTAAAKAQEAHELSQLALQQARDEAKRWPERFPSP